MGLAITRHDFTPTDFERFAKRLRENLAALERILAQPGFGRGAQTLGAELELSIIDREARALPLNRTLLSRHADPHLQLELDRFNLEYNLPPVPLRGEPFRSVEESLKRSIDSLNATAAEHDGRVVPIGILPTLTEPDLAPEAMTDLPRYRGLSASLRKRRGGPFHVEIAGEESLSIDCDDVTLEGANTSLQVHLRVDPEDFAATYNAAQLVSPLVVAVAANSPTFLGKKLWDETRVALFRQSVDGRPRQTKDWEPPARVSYGHGWVREGAWELFAQSVALFPPLLPVVGDEHPLALVEDEALPELAELRLHQGTVWFWNRPIYDPSAGGHLRIEMRSLPSGPTAVDMAANIALLVGLARGMRDRMKDLIPALPFRYARLNFYRAAERSLDATLLWPSDSAPSPVEVPVRELLETLLPIAAEGLAASGVADAEIGRTLGVIRRRLETGQTGARWQRRVLDGFEREHGRDDALRRMLERYCRHAAEGRPVAEWEVSA